MDGSLHSISMAILHYPGENLDLFRARPPRALLQDLGIGAPEIRYALPPHGGYASGANRATRAPSRRVGFSPAGSGRKMVRSARVGRPVQRGEGSLQMEV